MPETDKRNILNGGEGRKWGGRTDSRNLKNGGGGREIDYAKTEARSRRNKADHLKRKLIKSLKKSKKVSNYAEFNIIFLNGTQIIRST
jgi:hypothetical protein